MKERYHTAIKGSVTDVMGDVQARMEQPAEGYKRVTNSGFAVGLYATILFLIVFGLIMYLAFKLHKSTATVQEFDSFMRSPVVLPPE